MTETAVTQESNAVTPVTSVTRNATPLSNAERQARYRARRKAQAQAQAADSQTTDTPAKVAKPNTQHKGEEADKNGNQHAVTLRPSKRSRPRMAYTPEIGLKICERIALREPLRKICAEPDMPCEREVYYWRLEHPDFMHNYARAREHRAELRADKIDDYIEMVRTGELDANSARVIIDAEKWQAGKELPKRYGDKLEVDAKAALVMVETPAAIKALLEALPDLGVLPLPLTGPVIDIEADEVPVAPVSVEVPFKPDGER